MKWIWFLLFLAVVGEIMDNMEYADAAKKKKKKVTKKKKAKKGKAKKKKPTTRKPNSGNSNPLFYSPMPPAGHNSNDPNGGVEIIVPSRPSMGGSSSYGLPAAMPYGLPVVTPAPAPAAAITGQKGLKKNGYWLQKPRQRRYVHENALILEQLGLIENGKVKEFGVDRPKRSFRMLKVASTRNGLDNPVDENNNVTEKIKEEIRRKRDLDEKLQEMQANRKRNTEQVKKKQEELNRPKRSPDTLDKDRLTEQRDKMRQAKDKLQKRRDEVSERHRRATKLDEAKDKQKDNRETLQARRNEMKEKIGRPKRESQLERAKEKLQTRRQKQQEKRKQKQEKQQAKRNERRQQLNAKRNHTEPGGHPQIMPYPTEQLKPTFQAQVMPYENTEMRMKREIDVGVSKLQVLNPEDEDSSSSEECLGEDCSSDESCVGPGCSDDSDEDVDNTIRLNMPPVDTEAKINGTLAKMEFVTLPSRPKREEDQDSKEDCLGEDCSSSEECIGDDCTYEDSDESEEVPKVVAKRQAEAEEVRTKREVLGPKRTVVGFGSQKQMAGCGGNGGTDYEYGTDYEGDYEEEQRRRRRRKNKNKNKNNRRNRNNRRNKKRKNNTRPNRRQQSHTSMDQANTSPYDNVASAKPGSSFAPYLPSPNPATSSSGLDMMGFDTFSPPSSFPGPNFNMVHALRKRQVQETTTGPPRPIAYTMPPVRIGGNTFEYNPKKDYLGGKPNETTRPKREVSKGRPSENQPGGGKSERRQGSDSSESPGRRLERQKREFDTMALMISPPTSFLTNNQSNYDIKSSTPQQNSPVLPGKEGFKSKRAADENKVPKRERVDRPEHPKRPDRPKGPRNGNNQVDRPKRDLFTPMPVEILPFPPGEYPEKLVGQTFGLPSKGTGYRMQAVEIKVKREAHEPRHPNQQRDRGPPRRPEGNNGRPGEESNRGDRPSRPPPRINPNERPKRSPVLDFEKAPDIFQNRMMVSLPEPGPSQNGFAADLPLQIETTGNSMLVRQRREGPQRERPMPREDGKVPRQRQRHQKEDRPKRESPPASPYTIVASAYDNTGRVPVVIEPDFFAEDGFEPRRSISYSMPFPAYARTGSALAGVMKILHESDNSSESPPKNNVY